MQWMKTVLRNRDQLKTGWVNEIESSQCKWVVG